MHFHVITLFPEMFDSYLNESILGRAIKQKKIKISFINPRKFVIGKYKKVWPDGNVSLQIDDRPYGGGPGMVIRAEPVIKAVEFVIKKVTKSKRKILVINFIPSAEKFTTILAKKFSKQYTDIIMICGRYEGVDARVDKILQHNQNKFIKFKKISIGDYVLTGGEIPSMVLIDSISRQLPGILGKQESLEEERISSSEVYSRPETLIHKKKKYNVPKVLLSGSHQKINEWKNLTKKVK